MSANENVITHIRDLLGPKGWIGAEDGPAIAPYLREERGLYIGSALGVARPSSADEAAHVVEICAEAGIAVTAQGGNTGLVGGGVPFSGEHPAIVLSSDRLTRIRSIDAANRTITVEAGVILADVQKAAAEAGLLFPLSLGAEGSCRIGGNLSTNAGGVHVLRYGNARDLVLGLEVVLADGRVWDGLRGLRKDNTGYDLKQLFIGAEGTLGIITAATLKLYPRPTVVETALAALPGITEAMELFGRIAEAAGGAVNAYEVMNRFAVDIACRHVEGVRDPFAETHPQYALIELAGQTDGLRETLERVLAQAIDDGVAVDAVIAENIAQGEAFWAIREAIPEAQKREGGSIKHDVSVPLSLVAPFIDKATQALEAVLPGIRPCAFGHAGDGNIHFNISQPQGMDKDAYLEHWQDFNARVHDIVMEMGGSFSAEHGIGRLKRGDMYRYKSDVEIDLMRALKRALDPDGIMNPGKIFQ